MRINRILKYVSLAVIAVGASLMVGMLLWSYRLDADFSGRYECCTQQAEADFDRWFWTKFFVGGTLALTGCLALSAVAPISTAVKAGLVAFGIGIVGVFFTLSTNMHDWTGASAFTLSGIVFCCSAALLIVGGCRFGWAKLRSHSR
jgi:hypothetical protein